MLNSYEPFLEQLQKFATQNGLSELRLAREEFHKLTGEFDEGEPWFEVRMTMFLDWFLLDRPGIDGKTPNERYLNAHYNTLSKHQRIQHKYLNVTLRSAFRIIKHKAHILLLDDIIGGGQWRAHWTLPTIGLKIGDIFDARLVMVDDQLLVGRGAVLHPREAHEAIETIISRARKSNMPNRQLVDHLDKMRLKLDRYSNVKIRHVYQYPDDAVL